MFQFPKLRRSGSPPTCEVAQAQLPQAVVAVPPVVEEDGQRVAALVQLGAPDDAQVLQRQVVKLVEGHQHVAGHLPDRLRRSREDGNLSVAILAAAATLAVGRPPPAPAAPVCTTL